MSSAVTILVILAAFALALALAYIPMRLLISTIGRNIRQFIQRQRDRRLVSRETEDRRKESAPQEPQI